MSVGKWNLEWVDILLAAFTIYLFFFYFNIFFQRRKGNVRVRIGVAVLVLWQLGISDIIHILPVTWNIGVTMGFTWFAVTNIFEGKVWMKSFFFITFDALWMLLETLVGELLMIYGASIVDLQFLGSFISKLFFFMIIVALKKVFTNAKVMELPAGYSRLIVFIPIGSIYIMNVVFMLTYRTEWEYAEVYSIVSVIILLFINVLVFYIYIKLADDQQVRRMNLVYEQQLDLCERHQEETRISMLQMRDVRHNMRNHFISILAYAEMGECERIIKFVNDVMEEGKLKSFKTASTGNIVIDSLVGYWRKTAEDMGIEFCSELSIPMEILFKGSDISLILGNLLENAMEGAEKADGRKYIRLKIKYDKNNLLIVVENSYKGKLVRGRGEELRTTKTDMTNHGIGLASVQRAVSKYKGTMFIDDTVSERFLIRVVLYGI